MPSGWRVTPQAQLSYAGVAFDDFTGNAGETVSLVDGSTVQGRFGVYFERDWDNGSAFFGTVSLAEPLNESCRLPVAQPLSTSPP